MSDPVSRSTAELSAKTDPAMVREIVNKTMNRIIWVSKFVSCRRERSNEVTQNSLLMGTDVFNILQGTLSKNRMRPSDQASMLGEHLSCIPFVSFSYIVARVLARNMPERNTLIVKGLALL